MAMKKPPEPQGGNLGATGDPVNFSYLQKIRKADWTEPTPDNLGVAQTFYDIVLIMSFGDERWRFEVESERDATFDQIANDAY